MAVLNANPSNKPFLPYEKKENPFHGCNVNIE